jgi:hypothetical protein
MGVGGEFLREAHRIDAGDDLSRVQRAVMCSGRITNRHARPGSRNRAAGARTAARTGARTAARTAARTGARRDDCPMLGLRPPASRVNGALGLRSPRPPANAGSPRDRRNRGGEHRSERTCTCVSEDRRAYNAMRPSANSHSASARRPASAVLGGAEHRCERTFTFVSVEHSAQRRNAPPYAGGKAGRKKDERRASPPAFVTSGSLGPTRPQRQCRMALSRGQVFPRPNEDGVGAACHPATGSFRHIDPPWATLSAHLCGQVPPISSRSFAGHMAPGIREPCR